MVDIILGVSRNQQVLPRFDFLTRLATGDFETCTLNCFPTVLHVFTAAGCFLTQLEMFTSEHNNLDWAIVDQFILKFQNQFDVVDTRGVHRAGGLGLFGEQREREAVCERFRDQGVVLVGLDQAEVTAFLGAETGQVIQAQVHELHGVTAPLARVVEPVVDVHLALTLHSPQQFNDGVIEVQIHANLLLVRHNVEVLNLVDQLFERAGRETITLVDIEVHVGGQQARIQIVLIQRLARIALQHQNAVVTDLDAVEQVGEHHVDLDTVELQRHQGQRIAGGLGEPERQRHVQAAIFLRVGNQLRTSVTLANHFSQTLTGLASKFFPHVQVVGVQDRDHLATDDQAGALHEELADRVGPVRPRGLKTSARVKLVKGFIIGVRVKVIRLRRRRRAAIVAVVRDRAIAARVAVRVGRREHRRADAANALSVVNTLDGWQVDHDIHEVNQITSTVKSHLAIRAERHLRVEGLFNRFHRIVGVLVVTETEERDSGVGRQVLIGGTEGNQFGQRTTTAGTNTSGRGRGHGHVERVFLFIIFIFMF